MSEGPTDRQIQRVREALDRHDSELREEDDAPDEEAEEPSGDDEDDG